MTRGDIYFAGDVHLVPEPLPHPGREAFLEFLGRLAGEEPGELWLTGDLFDFWFEYRSAMPAGYDRALKALSVLAEKGWRTVFLPGNHDWWVGGHFERATGVRIDRSPFVRTDCFGIRTVIAHGDGLGRGDIGYRLIRPVLRARLSSLLFRMLHPDIGASIAGLASGTSRRILRREILEIPPGLSEWVSDMVAGGAGAVVTSHIHTARIAPAGPGVHISTGDWITTFTCARIGPGGPELLNFPPGGSR